MVENAEAAEEFPEPDPLEEAVEAFLECRHRGEEPSIEEYVAKFPDQSGELRELLSAVDIAFDLGRDEPDSSTVPVGAPTRDGQPLRQLGEYSILREVGRGGMGVVYEARQESLGRHVALKVLPFHALADPKRRERFRREARAAASLHHTNIVPVYGVGEEEGICFYAMQFIQGHGLDEILKEVRRLRAMKDGGNLKGLPSGDDVTSCATVLLLTTLPVAADRREPDPAAGERPSDPARLEGVRSVGDDSSSQGSSVGDLERRDLYFYNVARIG